MKAISKKDMGQQFDVSPTSGWKLNGKNQTTYIKAVQVWENCIEVYLATDNPNINNKEVLSIESVIEIPEKGE